MKTKAPYEKTRIEFVLLSNTDIITASGNNIGEDEGENDGEWI